MWEESVMKKKAIIIIIAIVLIVGIVLAIVLTRNSNNSTKSNGTSSNDTVSTSWGPQDRKTYDWNARSDTVSFNSITNNPSLGDERNFVRIRKVGGTESDEVALEPNAEYEVSIYYHNDAKESLNNDGSGISRDTSIRVKLPSNLNSGEVGSLVGYLNASNATPNEIWDSCYLKANSNIYISFVPNSAQIYNNGTANGTTLNDEKLLSSGVPISYYDNMQGMIPAGVNYGGYVSFKIKTSVNKP